MRALLLTLLLTGVGMCFLHPRGDVERWLAAGAVAAVSVSVDLILPRRTR